MARSLLTKYLVVLTLLTGFTTAGYFVVQHLIAIQRDNGSLVTLSGNQLMLSQRIVTTAVGLVLADDEATRQQSAELLLDSVETMANAHSLLTAGTGQIGDIFSRSEILQDIYFAQPYLLDQQVKRFLERARTLTTTTDERQRQAAVDTILNLSGGNLSEGLSLAVRQYQAEVEGRIKTLESIRLAILAAIYALLAMDALLIVRPLAAMLKKGEQELVALKERMEAQSTVDPLTRVLNRKAFDTVLDRELANVSRYGGDISLLLVDVDHFKVLNTQYGREGGDRLLQELALLLQNNVRQTDYVFRTGGAEFAVLTVSTTLDGALLLAEKISGLVRANSFHDRIRLTVRIGVAHLEAEETGDLLTARASEALEQARHSESGVAEASGTQAPPAKDSSMDLDA